MNVVKLRGYDSEYKIVLEHIAAYSVHPDVEGSEWCLEIVTSGESLTFLYDTEQEARAQERRLDELLGYTGD